MVRLIPNAVIEFILSALLYFLSQLITSNALRESRPIIHLTWPINIPSQKLQQEPRSNNNPESQSSNYLALKNEMAITHYHPRIHIEIQTTKHQTIITHVTAPRIDHREQENR